MVRAVLLLSPIFILVAVAFWIIFPAKNPQSLTSDQNSKVPDMIPKRINDLQSKVDLLENKLDTLEGSNSRLLSKITSLQSTENKKQTPAYFLSKTPVLIPINPGGTLDTKDWKNLTSGSIKINPADYPGYKQAYLIINLSVYVGQGKAFARLVNPDAGLAILESEVSTNAYAPITLTSKPFRLPTGPNTYTVQVKTLVEGGYPVQAGNSFLQITY